MHVHTASDYCEGNEWVDAQLTGDDAAKLGR